ncbi:MAG: exo-alpha-sialidase [Clostridia bacterium]|nr:exo-alpha-sialidase [Clostridia bacterium]
MNGHKDDALLPAVFHYDPTETDPSCRFANENRKFQGIPAIEKTPGGWFYAAFYGGMTCEESGNFVIVLRHRNPKESFGQPWLIVEAPTPECRTFDPCLWIDPHGKLWLYYSQSYTYIDGRIGVWAAVCDDPDADEPRFSSPRRIANGVMMNKPTCLSTGEWLLCCTIWCDELSDLNDIPEERFSNVYCSTDSGQTFTRIGYTDYADRSTDEPMIVEKNDGQLWMLIRGKHGIGQGFSDDKGYTWHDIGFSGIENPCSRFHIRRLPSGRLLFINHKNFKGQNQENVIVGSGRNNLTAMLSDDDGKTWSEGLLLDERNEVSYPDVTVDADGRIWIIYDRERYKAKEILMASVTEEDILAGSLVNEKSFLRQVINQGAKQ